MSRQPTHLSKCWRCSKRPSQSKMGLCDACHSWFQYTFDDIRYLIHNAKQSMRTRRKHALPVGYRHSLILDQKLFELREKWELEGLQ